MIPPPAPPPRDCAVCALPLGYDTSRGYVHFQRIDLDHVPVPVEPGQVQTRYRCDFCNVDLTGTWWSIPTRDFEADFSGTDYTTMDTEGWAACQDCAPYVDVRDWRGLLRRVVQSMHIDGPPPSTEIRVRFMETYRRLDEAICGPMVEVTGRPD